MVKKIYTIKSIWDSINTLFDKYKTLEKWETHNIKSDLSEWKFIHSWYISFSFDWIDVTSYWDDSISIQIEKSIDIQWKFENLYEFFEKADISHLLKINEIKEKRQLDMLKKKYDK